VLGLELRAFTLSHSTSPIFCDRVFQDGVLQIICPGWLQTAILLIFASLVARIIGVSHRHPASTNISLSSSVYHVLYKAVEKYLWSDQRGFLQPQSL
jgi:hypothetical protein